MTYVPFYCMKPLCQPCSLKEAVKVLLEKVREDVVAGGANYQVLDTMTWIENDDGKITLLANFDSVRDFAYDQGWMKDGKWVG